MATDIIVFIILFKIWNAKLRKFEQKNVTLPKIIYQMKKLICICAAALLLNSCNDDSEPTPVATAVQRAVIVYMSGENNLGTQGYLGEDLNEIITGSKSIPEDDRLVVFVDNSSSRKTPYIIEVRNEVCDTIVKFDKDFYASDPARFVDIIKTIQEKYQAKEYGLVLWGHATGWLVTADSIAESKPANGRKHAYGADTGNNQSYSYERWMNITQMARAMKQLPHFKYIFADCCCMMNVEVAYELRNATDYLIGSPAEIPGKGAPYHIVMKDLFLRSDDFYKTLMDDYYNYYISLYKNIEYTGSSMTSYLKGHSVPLAVVDMRYIEQLASATRNLLKEPDAFETDSVPYYFITDVPIMYDMGCLMERICSNDDYRLWKEALNKAVPYRLFSARWMTIYNTLRNDMKRNYFLFNEDNFTGISMFVPKTLYNFSSLYQYNATIPSFSWYQAVGWDRFAD